MDEPSIDLVYRVLDHQLIDVEGRRCGRVDDVEFEGSPGEPVYLRSILSGHGAWPERLPRRLRRLGRRVFGEAVRGTKLVSVPWADVEDVDRGTVRLRQPAHELGLARTDAALAPLLERQPKG
jgi:hypothetical protein